MPDEERQFDRFRSERFAALAGKSAPTLDELAEMVSLICDMDMTWHLDDALDTVLREQGPIWGEAMPKPWPEGLRMSQAIAALRKVADEIRKRIG